MNRTGLYLLFGAAVAFAASKAKAAPKKEEPNGSSGPSAGPAQQGAGPSVGDVAKGIDDLLKTTTGTGVTGLVGLGIKTLFGGGAAGGGAAGAGGGTATATGATAGAGTGGSAGTASAGSATVATVSGGSASLIIGIAVIIAAYIAIRVLDEALKGGTDISFRLSGLLPNARALHRFEAQLFEKWRTLDIDAEGKTVYRDLGGAITQQKVRDIRLDLNLFSRTDNKTFKLIGERVVYNYTPSSGARASWMGGDSPAVAWLRVQKQFRRLALEYLQWRGMVANNLAQRGNVTKPFDWDYYSRSMYTGLRGDEQETAGYGGLLDVPLLDGQTKFSQEALVSIGIGMRQADRAEALAAALIGRPTSQRDDEVLEAPKMVARDAAPDESFTAGPFGMGMLKSMRLKGTLEAIETYFSIDPTPLIFIEDYMKNVAVPWIGLGAEHLQPMYMNTTPSNPLWWMRGCLITTTSTFGMRVVIDVAQIRLKNIDHKSSLPQGSPARSKAWMLAADLPEGHPDYYKPVAPLEIGL